MNKSVETYTPRARQDDLVVEALGDETLVYDMRTHKAHCLNRTAALIWNRCDGQSSVSEVRAALESELGTPVTADLVWLALSQLGKRGLLASPLPGSTAQHTMTRRSVMRRIGFGAAAALPLITSILAPTVAEAGTCGHTGASCNSATDCCSGCVCNAGVCAGC